MEKTIRLPSGEVIDVPQTFMESVRNPQNNQKISKLIEKYGSEGFNSDKKQFYFWMYILVAGTTLMTFNNFMRKLKFMDPLFNSHPYIRNPRNLGILSLGISTISMSIFTYYTWKITLGLPKEIEMLPYNIMIKDKIVREKIQEYQGKVKEMSKEKYQELKQEFQSKVSNVDIENFRKKYLGKIKKEAQVQK